MTILNENKKSSEDYTFVINIEEFFQANPTIYARQNNTWSALSSGSNFNTLYQALETIILSNNPITLLDTDANYNDLANDVYIGIKTADQTNFPDITNGQSFILVKNSNTIACMPTKLSSLEGIKVVKTTNYTPAEEEYLSAKQTYEAISLGADGDGPSIPIVTEWQSEPSNSNIPSEKLVKDTMDALIGDIINYIEGDENDNEPLL